MGGKIVEGLERLTREQYWFLVGWLKNILPSRAGFYIPRKFFDKESFGDVDIVYGKKDVHWNELAVFLFQQGGMELHERIENKNMKSWIVSFPKITLLGDKKIQLDFIHCDGDTHYYDFGLLAPLVGKLLPHSVVLRPVGLTLRGSGTKDGEGELSVYGIGNVPFSEVLSFLGYDKRKWNEGFQNEMDMIRWIASSQFFTKRHLTDRPSNSKKEKRDLLSGMTSLVEALKAFPDASEDLMDGSRKNGFGERYVTTKSALYRKRKLSRLVTAIDTKNYAIAKELMYSDLLAYKVNEERRVPRSKILTISAKELATRCYWRDNKEIHNDLLRQYDELVEILTEYTTEEDVVDLSKLNHLRQDFINMLDNESMRHDFVPQAFVMYKHYLMLLLMFSQSLHTKHFSDYKRHLPITFVSHWARTIFSKDKTPLNKDYRKALKEVEGKILL